MSFQGKAFWMAKDGNCLNDGEMGFDGSSRIVYDNSSRVEPKRAQPWFLDAPEPDMFPNKKQAVESSNRSLSGVSNANITQWENASSFQAVPNQFTDRLFGSEQGRNFNFGSRTIPSIGAGNLNLGRPNIEDQFGNDSSIALSMSHTIEDPASCLSYGGIRKVKINQVKDADSGLSASGGQTSNTRDTNTICFSQVQDTENNMPVSVGHSFNKGESGTISFNQGKDSDGGIPVSVGHTFSKGDSNTISFSGFQDESEANPSGQLISSYDLLLSQSSAQPSETLNQKEVNSNTEVTRGTPQLTTASGTASKNKTDPKPSKKPAPNNFPSNVRSLLSTGILDDVPVKYIAWSREELRGVIKGSGYLCGCQSCSYNKVLNAYEFERHAGCKTKHPNNHIYFENGKTIYAVVQELRSTPQSLLFEAIQTVTGSPVNEKSFRIWKESFQAATRELQRIYGKDDIQQL
ncbi:hypothetical protein AQUCO_01000700v1 [Aquilegia coerulea]|uniref:Tify domain-containing protein n=1 Tax=Aquilegia coerulea TaxID=218851 RepID=A0A2G5EB84_AQUCA|nr:hypothetical protein AQUCO_01000700v1 [Aquilegia coerulea]